MGALRNAVLVVLAGLWGCSDRHNNFTDPDAGDVPDTGVMVVDTGPADSGQCASDPECDDHIACTSEVCVVGGICERTAHSEMCPMGQRCILGQGCGSGTTCRSNMECDDGVTCTQDICVAGGTCQHIRDDSRCTAMQICSATRGCIAMGTCDLDPDCDDRQFCNGTERCTGGHCTPGTPPNCADMDLCTGDVCNPATGMCEHPRLDPCGGTVVPGMYTLTPAPAYSCGAGSFGPVMTVTLSTTGGTTVAGYPVTLTGSAPAGNMFSASGVWSQGGCQWTFTLAGAFTMANRFTGTSAVSFGGLCDASLRCFGQTVIVNGALR